MKVSKMIINNAFSIRENRNQVIIDLKIPVWDIELKDPKFIIIDDKKYNFIPQNIEGWYLIETDIKPDILIGKEVFFK